MASPLEIAVLWRVYLEWVNEFHKEDAKGMRLELYLDGRGTISNNNKRIRKEFEDIEEALEMLRDELMSSMRDALG